MIGMRKFGLLGTSALRSAAVLGLATLVAGPAFGQSAPAETNEPKSTVNPDEPEQLGQSEVELESGQSADDGAGEEILVTGSRIRRPNLDSGVPITSVGAQELTQRGDISLGDALNDLPSLRSTFSQANSTTSIGTAGLSLLDLRGLGTTRTLVLVNGRRHVTAQPGNYNVDVNTIPVDLLERVDVVTGGNSAVYGSDAIAGVVNFVLRRNFEGVKIRGQGGVSTYGDRGNYFVSAIAGHNFFDDRVNVALHGEYTRAKEVFYSDRPYLGAFTGPSGFITSEITNAPNRNFNGIPNTVFLDNQNGTRPGIVFGNASLGGYVSPACTTATAAQIAAFTPAQAATYNSAVQVARRAAACTGATTPTGGFISRNYAFLPDGTLAADIPSGDNRAIGGGVIGGLSATGLEDAMLLPGLERIVGNLLINAEISPAFQPFLEAKFVRINATQQSTQPTFTSGSLSAVFNINNPFLSNQARTTLQTLNPGATTFSAIRFNNDLGTRAEDHRRDTYRVVAGVRGDLSTTGNLRYEAAFNYGRTETFYETGGNVLVANFNRAANAVAGPSGPICFINSAADVIAAGQPNAGQVNTANDDPACVPINLFGRGAPSQAARDYVLYTSTREEKAEQINATAFISGDTTGLFELPGGAIGAALGVEYRRESAFSAYDPVTQSGATFLNAFQPFDPPAQEVREVFGEIRIPLLRDTPFFRELTVEGAARYSDYNNIGGVWAYNGSVIWSPVRGLRLRGGYARSVRAPNLSNLFATAAQTFANGLTDPCDQPGGTNASNNISADPNRVRNCAAAGIPTTITYTDQNGNTVTRPFTNIPGSGVAGVNAGNPNLLPETSDSFTLGAVFQPEFIAGFSFTVDYFNIKVKNVISGLTGQAIINRCYDDPTGIDNPFCAAVFRRTSPDPVLNGTFLGQTTRRLENRAQDTIPTAGNGISFLNAPFNFAALEREGIDFDFAYRARLGGETVLNLRAIVSYLMKSENFTYITQPDRSDRIHGTLGDPIWAASFNANLDFGAVDLTYSASYVGRQTILSYETQFTHQGRGPTNPDARPFRYYPDVLYHNFRIGVDPTEKFSFYAGVDNVLNRRPPYDLTGLEAGSPFSPTGRFFYAGAEVRF
jgi:outer membrane receptor protein involved in Fe transport